jgi:hypothetical protein
MHLAISPAKRVSKSKARISKSPERAGSKCAIDEINAYIVIRDELLAEAEELRTRAKLDSATVANDFVQICLTPARAPYEAQSLPESDAIRERERCEVVKHRIAKLREQVTI